MQRISAADYKKLVSGQAKRGRYGGNRRISTKEGHFDSKGEYRRWKNLCIWEADGVIADLERQVDYSFDLNDRHICIYKADFRYRIVSTGEVIVEDHKGMYITPEFNLKRKLMKAFFDIDVKIIRKVTTCPLSLSAAASCSLTKKTSPSSPGTESLD